MCMYQKKDITLAFLQVRRTIQGIKILESTIKTYLCIIYEKKVDQDRQEIQPSPKIHSKLKSKNTLTPQIHLIHILHLKLYSTLKIHPTFKIHSTLKIPSTPEIH